MSQRYKGAVISATPPTVSATSPNAYGTAKGVWTLQQQMQYEGGGTWPSPFAPTYIEDVFSTYLYTGNGSTQTITNGIDLSGEGGLVWIKNRTSAITHGLYDTERGATYWLASNTSDEQVAQPTQLTAFNNNGFSLGASSTVNGSSANYASWTFRKAEKFFDVVTYTGNGASSRAISHNLGSAPGCIIVKSTSNAFDWKVYHRSEGSSKYLTLNKTLASATNTNVFAGIDPTASNFYVGPDIEVNGNGYTYVAYLFAHNAGGFGDSGSDNVISCGSFTTDGSGNATVSLGYEPQWVLIKQTDGVDSWYLNDNMRGMAVSGNQPNLSPNSSAAESAGGYNTYPNATGFTASVGIASKNYIYIAIRRGPMRTPTDATKVFAPVAWTGTGTNPQTVTSGFPVDVSFNKKRTDSSYGFDNASRLAGITKFLETFNTSAEQSGARLANDSNTALLYGNANGNWWNQTGNSMMSYFFRRAPGFMDVVCYTGTGVARTVNHNLGVVPELMIVKDRTSATNWGVWNKDIFAANSANILILQLANAATSGGAAYFNSTAPTASVFTVGTASATNGGGENLVAYLFASCPGVSKVGSYTGTETTQQINCGFTGGARFVLIKRTDSTGDWYVWDSARGIVAGNDPYLLLNSTAAEVTNTDYVDTYAQGFEISSTAPAAINANGGTFIYLAIA